MPSQLPSDPPRCGWPKAALLVGLLIAVSWGSSPRADEAARYDLDALVEVALEREAGYRAVVAQREEVLGGVDEAAADAWPQIDLTSGWGRSRNPSLLNSPDFDDILEQFPDFEPGEQELWNLAFELEQTIYSGGKVQAALDLAKLAVDIQEASLGTRRLELAAEVSDAYFALLDAQASLRTLEAQEEARQSALDVVEARYEIGEATQLERLQARAALAELAPTAATAEGRRLIAESRLQRLLGLDEPPQLIEPERHSMSEPPTLEALYRSALERRPELAELAKRSEALDRQKTIIEAEARPQLELRGAYGRQARLPEDLSDSLFEDWRIDLAFSWNLFDGGRRRGQVRQIEAQRDQVEWRLVELERRVRDELRTASAEMSSSCARYQAAEISSEAAREAARVAAESFGQGVALQADLLDANERATRQGLLLDQAFYACRQAAIRLKIRAGLMPAQAFGAASAEEN